MTTTAEGSPVTTRRPKNKPTHAQSSIWSKEIGRKGDEDVDHPPFLPALPRVNLLPPSVPEYFLVRGIRRWFISIAVLLTIAFACVWYLQVNQIADAEGRLAQAQADSAKISAQVSALAPIKEMYDQITAEQSLVATTLASAPQASLVVARLADAGLAAQGSGGPVAFTSVAIEYRGIPEPGAELNPCPNPDPFSSDITIGCITFSGTASNREQVSAMLSIIAGDSLFVGPYVNNSTVTQATADVPGGVMFTGTAGVSIDALAKALTPEQIGAIVSPPVDPSATAAVQAP